MNASTSTGKHWPTYVDLRLIALDPDFEELFAEVEEALRVARVHWVPRLRTTGAPRPRTAGCKRPPSRPRGRRPHRFRARERGPPDTPRMTTRQLPWK
ncbi:hypothetical protein ABZV91_30600 [Nocardia sp. NPDC004568]|uniref:hypothetical protein n=1 Tax=Nocardia sp. NPDC004568 TaxID=3154551 RepID=UPI0033A192B9